MGIPDHLQECFFTDVDGFVYFWPTGRRGHFAAHHLREIAGELDRRNADWAAYIEKELSEEVGECDGRL